MSEREWRILVCMGSDELSIVFAQKMVSMISAWSLPYRLVSSQAEALSVLEREQIDVVLLDILGVRWDALAYLDELFRRGTPVIAICERSTEEVAINIMKRGAADYLIKGEFSSDQLYQSIRHAGEKSYLRAELLRKQKELEDFAYVASHDLNAPLYKIRQCCDLIREVCGDSVPERARVLLDIIARGCEQMNSLINDLLDYSRVEKERKIIEELDLNTVVSEVLALYKTNLEERKAVVEVGDLPKIQISRVSMRQLFQNLIGNALKYNVAEIPRIVVSGSLEPYTDGPGVRLTVDDNGIGIDPKYYQRIFKPFERLHTQSEFPGSGLGLAICKKLVDQSGGTIEVIPSLLGGTQFCVRFPLT
jgi:signal transduction histidine kinase